MPKVIFKTRAKKMSPRMTAKIRAAARGVAAEKVGKLMAFGNPELAKESLGNRMAGMKKRFKRLSQTKLKKRG